MINETVTQEMIDCMKKQELRTEYLKTVIKERGLRNLYDYLISVRLITDSWNTFQHQFTRTINSKGLLNRLYLIEPICLFLGIPVSKVFCSTDLEKTITMQDVEKTSLQVCHQVLAIQKAGKKNREPRLVNGWFLKAYKLGNALIRSYSNFEMNYSAIVKFHLFTRADKKGLLQDADMIEIFEFIKTSHNMEVYNWMINAGVEYDFGYPPYPLDFQTIYGKINQFANLTLMLAYLFKLVKGIMQIAKKPHAFILADNCILYTVVNWENGKEKSGKIVEAILNVREESMNLNRILYQLRNDKSDIPIKVINSYIGHAHRFIQYLNQTFIIPFFFSNFPSLVGVKPDYCELDIFKQQPNANFLGNEFLISNQMVNQFMEFVSIWNTTSINKEISRMKEDAVYIFTTE